MSRYNPALSLRALTTALRAMNDAFDGPGEACMGLLSGDLHFNGNNGAVGWVDGELNRAIGWESLPGDGKPFDAIAVARRLLAELTEARKAEHDLDVLRQAATQRGVT